MPLRRRPKSNVACARRDSFERFEGFPIDSRRMALNWRKASAVTAVSKRLAVGKMLVGRRLRDAELLGQRADADRFGAAEFDFCERGLNQGIAEIPMVVGVERFACGARRHLSVMIYNFPLDSTIAPIM